MRACASFITSVAELIEEPQSSTIVLTVINLLCNEEVGVLKPELRMMWRGRLLSVPDPILEQYFEVGELPDPDRGELLPEPAQHLVPMFRASPSWLQQEVAI
jgi:hypothetical protein